MSTTRFAQMERERLADEDYTEALRIERLKHAGKLCDKCFAIEGIERAASSFHCTHCGAWWAV